VGVLFGDGLATTGGSSSSLTVQELKHCIENNKTAVTNI
jgi:hypothetical protein